jgi:hypothetical protein
MRAILFLRRRRHATIVIAFILMHICLDMCCIIVGILLITYPQRPLLPSTIRWTNLPPFTKCGDTYPSYSPFSPIPGLGYREWVGPQHLIKEQNRILAQYTCPSLPERLGLDPLTNNAGELANLMWDIPGLVHLETMKDLKERLESYGWMDYFIQGTSFMVRPKVELENGLLGRDILTFTQVLALVRRKNERWTATYPQGRFNQRKVQTAVGLPPMCLYLPCPFCPQVF